VITIDPRLHRIVAAQPYPLLFATISGAHLYGFPSPDSDFDLRGAHVLPVEKVVGLEIGDETVEQSFVVPPATSSGLRREVISPDCPHPASPPSPAPAGEGQCAEGRALEMDIVSHDVRKFFSLLLKKNGYVLEQLFSPLVVHTTPEHEELKEICRTRISTPHPGPHPGRGGAGGENPLTPALSPSDGERVVPQWRARVRGGSGVITKHHSHHYFGFAETQWKLFLKESPRRVKPLLYVYRVLLTGIHLMRSGAIEANLVTLNEEFRLPYLAELIERKTKGENTALADADIAFHELEYQRLRGELQAAHDASQLPELPSDETRAALNDLLVRIRLQSIRKASS
jgi:uncharacterized protein